jgi:hypothetical protein
MKTSYVTQFGRAESVASEQRLLLPVTKAHTNHSLSDLRTEEAVRLLADHGDPQCTIGYVTAPIYSAVKCVLNRSSLTVLDFVLFWWQ